MANQIRVVFNNLPQLAAALGTNADRIVEATANAIAADAAGSAPHLTGALAGSIKASKVGQNHYRVTTGVDYAVYVEMGTGHGPAQPYMVPSAHNAEPGFVAAMAGVVTGA